jgi:two-component system nitrogen regulation response regulator NtrX
LNYNWPGNVRELRNLIEKIVISTPANEIDIDEVRNALEASKANSWTSLTTADDEILELSGAMQDFEKRYILSALHKYDWKMQETAKALGIDRSNLFKKMRKHGINK